MTSRAESLLAGPRGRRLCAELLATPDGELGPPRRWDRLSLPITDPAEHARVLDDVRAALQATDLTAVALPGGLQAALLASVDRAVYWQEPFEVDQVVAALLAPVAEVVAAAPPARWWAEPMDPAGQFTVGWPHGDRRSTSDRTPPGRGRGWPAGGRTRWPRSSGLPGSGRPTLPLPGVAAGGPPRRWPARW